MTQALGVHYLLELRDCDPRIIDYLPEVQRILLEAARRSRATIIDTVFRKFVSKWENRYNADVSLPRPSMRVIRRIARLIRQAVRRLPPLGPWEEELRFMDRRASGPPAGPGRSGAPVSGLPSKSEGLRRGPGSGAGKTSMSARKTAEAEERPCSKTPWDTT